MADRPSALDTAHPLAVRFLQHLTELELANAPSHLLVAVSGGCDSMVLLHLLRFAAGCQPWTITVAHLDHAMRPDSATDARWLKGVCAAWNLPLVHERVSRRPASEDDARRARYAFLRRAADRCAADLVLTAHHADDQAETVLFRALRGTGLSGLAGIPARTDSGLVRPLLPFWREELEAYAREQKLRWRTDSSNRSLDPTRNRIRLQLLPLIEREIAPGARRNLVSLAELAREAEDFWERELGSLERLIARSEDGTVVLARAMLRDYDSALAARVLRRLLRRFGVVLDRTGTRTALQFITDAPSGRELQLPSGVRIRLEFDAARIERDTELPADRSLEIPQAEMTGTGVARFGGRDYRVTWHREIWGGAPEASSWRAALDLAALRFPLQLRSWLPGDRIRTPAGTKTLKKLFLERRVPRSQRATLPVLADAAGSVLWVGGIDCAPVPAPRVGGETFLLTFLHD